MKNVDMAEAYLEQAKIRLRTAGQAFRGGNYAFAVRQSQECAELSLKAALRLYGVEYPREHDVGVILPRVADRFPGWFSAKIEEFSRISAALAKDRGPSMYGDEERGVPPSSLFDEGKAKAALEGAEVVNRACRKLADEFLGKAKIFRPPLAVGSNPD